MGLEDKNIFQVQRDGEETVEDIVEVFSLFITVITTTSEKDPYSH
jgi:hypothetical protein